MPNLQQLLRNFYSEYTIYKALRYKGCGFDPRWCHWNFSLTYFRPYYGHEVDSASNSNEYEECFLGVKAAGV